MGASTRSVVLFLLVKICAWAALVLGTKAVTSRHWRWTETDVFVGLWSECSRVPELKCSRISENFTIVCKRSRETGEINLKKN